MRVILISFVTAIAMMFVVSEVLATECVNEQAVIESYNKITHSIAAARVFDTDEDRVVVIWSPFVGDTVHIIGFHQGCLVADYDTGSIPELYFNQEIILAVMNDFVKSK